MATRQVQAGNQTVKLAGIDLLVKGQVREQDLARFQGKITSGDYSWDSDPLLSVWITTSLVGGIGSEKLKMGVDDENYWTGTLETRFPGMVSLPTETLSYPGPDGAVGSAFPLGDFPAAAPSLYAAFGSTLARWVEADEEFVSVGNLGSAPSGKAVELSDVLWIPLGLGGYATVDALNVITIHSDLDVVAFTLWDNKIAALTKDGVLRLRPGLAGAWEADDPNLHLPSGHLPRGLVVFLNQQEEPTIHIITNRDVWSYDRELSRIVRTQLQFPRHPDQGHASTVWRGDSMFVSVGLGIHSYTGGVITSMGPDGRYGMPADLRGRVVDLEPEYNGLIAVVEGKTVVDETAQEVEIMPPTYLNPFRPFSGASAHSTILRYSGFGWHPVWTSDDREGFPTWAFVSIADNEYRLWWGYAGKMYYQNLRVTFHNPKAGMRIGEDRFAPKGQLVTGWFDADMRGFDKLASHIEISMVDVFETGQPTGTIRVEYQIDTDPGWFYLGKVEQIGVEVLPFGEMITESSDGFSGGLRFRRIRLRYTFESSDPNLSPVLEAVLLKFIKLPISGKSWTFTAYMDQDDTFMGNGVRTMQDRIASLATEDTFHEFVHLNVPYRVRVAQTTKAQETGHDPRSIMQISVVEVKLPASKLKAIPSGT